jgi:hypothetical protein
MMVIVALQAEVQPPVGCAGMQAASVHFCFPIGVPRWRNAPRL